MEPLRVICAGLLNLFSFFLSPSFFLSLSFSLSLAFSPFPKFEKWTIERMMTYLETIYVEKKEAVTKCCYFQQF